MSRILWLEAQMNREDFDMSLFDQYAKELTQLTEAVDARRRVRQQELDQQRAEENAQAADAYALSLTDEEVDKMYSDFMIANADQTDEHGRTFADWFNITNTLYTIVAKTTHFEVTSVAKSDNAFVWSPFVSAPHARTKILQLIKIKFRDHHLRKDREGCDFANIPKED